MGGSLSEDADAGGGGGRKRSGRADVSRLGAVAALLAASVLLSRVLGYVREIALANQVGAGADVDAYAIAFLVPDLLNYLLAGGALSIAFIPLYARVLERDGDAAAGRLFQTVLGTLGAVVIVLTVVLWIEADRIAAGALSGFDPERRALAVRLTRILLPAQIFFVTGGILRAVLMAHGHFRSQAAAPLIYNICPIAVGLATGTVEGFAWGTLAGAVLSQWGYPFWRCAACGASAFGSDCSIRTSAGTCGSRCRSCWESRSPRWTSCTRSSLPSNWAWGPSHSSTTHAN